MARRLSRREFLHSLSLGAGLVVLAACGGTTATPAASTAAPQAAAPTATPAASDAPTAAPATGDTPTAAPAASGSTAGLPIVSSPLTLTYWAEMNVATSVTRKSFGEMTCYVEQEKRTGIHLARRDQRAATPV